MTSSNNIPVSHLAEMMISCTVVTSDLSTMRETPGLGPLKEMLELLCVQEVWRGGSGVQEMVQVRLMMLPFSTNISGPPSMMTSGSVINERE